MRDPTDADLIQRSYRALVLDEAAEYFRIIDVLTSWLKRHPLDAHALNNRAVAQLELGRLSEAREDLDRAVRTADQDVVPWANRGRLRATTGDAEGAIGDFTRAIAIQPFASEFIARARIHRQTGRLNEALRDFERALDLGGQVQAEHDAVLAEIATGGG